MVGSVLNDMDMGQSHCLGGALGERPLRSPSAGSSRDGMSVDLPCPSIDVVKRDQEPTPCVTSRKKAFREGRSFQTSSRS